MSRASAGEPRRTKSKKSCGENPWLKTHERSPSLPKTKLSSRSSLPPNMDLFVTAPQVCLCRAAHMEAVYRSHLPISWPLDQGRHGRKIESTLPPVLSSEDRAPIVEQIELNIAPAAHELLIALSIIPRLGKIAADDFRINRQKCLTDITGEGEIRREARGRSEIIVEDAADAARLSAMLQIKIFVAPFFEPLIVCDLGVAPQAAAKAA